MTGAHVGPSQVQQARQLVPGVAHQPPDGLVLPAVRVVLDRPHVQADQLDDGIGHVAWIAEVAQRHAGHPGSDLLVPDEGGLAIFELVDGGLTHIVHQRGEARDQLGWRQ